MTVSPSPLASSDQSVSEAVTSASRTWMTALRHHITHRRRFPWRWCLRMIVRGLILIVDYVVILMTVTMAIPTMGVWLYDQVRTTQGQLTVQGLIAVWAIPLLTLVAFTVIGECVVMRWWWRALTRVVDTRLTPSTRNYSSDMSMPDDEEAV